MGTLEQSLRMATERGKLAFRRQGRFDVKASWQAGRSIASLWKDQDEVDKVVKREYEKGIRI